MEYGFDTANTTGPVKFIDCDRALRGSKRASRRIIMFFLGGKNKLFSQ